MSILKNPKINLTLFIFIALLGLSTTVSASSHASGGISRRDHGTLKRFIKKRAPFPAATTAPADATVTAADSNLGGGLDGLTDIFGTQSSSQSTSESQSLSTSLSTSETSLSTSDSSTSSTSSTSSLSSSSPSSVSSSTSTSTTTSTTSQTSQTSESAKNTHSVSVAAPGTVTTTNTAFSAAETGNNDSNSTSSGLGTKGKTALITVLIVVASCVGGIAILWTVFRKWKLGRSSRFDQRLQPIDWQPTHEDDGIVPHHRGGSDTSSFHSGVDNSAGRGAAGYGATSDLGHGSDHGHRGFDPLEHDFTAGSNNHLAPVGGYADLARGPSPQPHMQESITRGPSLTRPSYDVGVPLHHQTGYGAQDAYDYNGGRY